MATNRVSPKGRKISDVPKTPVIGTATAGSGSASVTFTAAVGGLGGRTSSYSVRSTPGNFIGLGTSSPITVSGIVGYGSYTFSVAGINPSGTGTYSDESNAVTIQTVPGAPNIGTATATSSSDVSITFTPPANDGGLTITSYVVLSSSGLSTSGSSSPITLTEVMPGTYTYQVRAVNSIGTSTYSEASNSATVNPPLARISYFVLSGGGGATTIGYEATGGAGGGGCRGGNTGPGTIYFTQAPGVTYTVTVGAGSAGNANGPTPANGSPSSVSGSNISTITATGGAGGRYLNGNGSTGNSTGGSGSGGNGLDGTTTTWAGGTGNAGGYSPSEGEAGGSSRADFVSVQGSYRSTGGGGGGAGSTGQTGYTYWDGSGVRKRGGYGGNGKYFAEDGYAYYGGGGGAQNANLNFSFNNGGYGGGGNGQNNYDNPNKNGVANKGGGGGAGAGGGQPGGNGGSGIVILAYPNVFPDAVSYSGATYENNGTYKLYKFTGSGSIRFV